jgi:hypothetical protein
MPAAIQGRQAIKQEIAIKQRAIRATMNERTIIT